MIGSVTTTGALRSVSVAAAVSAWLPATSSARTRTLPLATANEPPLATVVQAPPLRLYATLATPEVRSDPAAVQT